MPARRTIPRSRASTARATPTTPMTPSTASATIAAAAARPRARPRAAWPRGRSPGSRAGRHRSGRGRAPDLARRVGRQLARCILVCFDRLPRRVLHGRVALGARQHALHALLQRNHLLVGLARTLGNLLERRVARRDWV